MQYVVHIDERGRLVLPAKLRRQLDLEKGEALLLLVESDGNVKLISPRKAARQGRGLLRRLAPESAERRLAEELIEERRKEAKIEAEHE